MLSSFIKKEHPSVPSDESALIDAADLTLSKSFFAESGN
jgi:hypothetical protein